MKRYKVFDVGQDHEYFNDGSETNLNNRKILQKVAGKSYLPANRLLLEMLAKYPEFKLAFSLSGVLIGQLEEYSVETLNSFKELVSTGRVELLSETYHHSLSFIKSKPEFARQVRLHQKKIKKVFGVTPSVFRNTELIYSNSLAEEVEKMGYKGILAEGVDRILGWRSPNFLYRPKGVDKIKLLLKNYQLSDDIAFRFSEKSWSEYPLTAPKFASWVSALNGNAEVVNLFMDYETFGEHQWEDSGIFDFLKHLPGEILRNPDNKFFMPSEVIKKYQARDSLDIPEFISWADIERDLSAWLSNPMQHDALEKLYGLENEVIASKNKKLVEDWRQLQTSDHFYYMCTKWFADGDVHKYFNPYNSPYDAYISFMNVLKDLELRLKI